VPAGPDRWRGSRDVWTLATDDDIEVFPRTEQGSACNTCHGVATLKTHADTPRALEAR